ncbi:hypothetical protein QAD02_004929 [Eretmocerus hayati]|uniref:Uncharacterized protein n=1 Tax=Eretmocerus hayati TaxID=131215 RepID=A0ACC2NRG4_9HYME|nr:hypothetical protein QAD02_004929 [Eretmocerus hayati]
MPSPYKQLNETSGVNICPRSAERSEYNKCLLKLLDDLKPHFSKGVPSMKLPALDPLSLPSLTIDRNLESLKIKANMSNINVVGGSNFRISDLNADPNGLTVTLKLLIPFVNVKGNYDVQGRLLLLPLAGVGSFKGNFTNTQVLINARGKEVTDKDGVKRVEVDKLQTKIRVGDGNIRLKSAPNHKATADAAANFFNANPRLVLDIATPIIEDTAVTVSKALAGRALSSFTKDELVPLNV